MKEKDIRNIWQNYSNRLETDLTVNQLAMSEENLRKARMTLKKLIYRRIAESVVYLIIVLCLIGFTFSNYPIPQYVLSGLMLGIFFLIGLTGSIGQIILIIKIDYSKPVTTLQLQLERLKVYSLQTLRLLFLSIPFYFAYIIVGFKLLFKLDIYAHADSKWLLWNIILSIAFVPLSVWIYRKLSYKAKSSWIKRVIADNGGKQIHSAIQFINEIEEYRNDSVEKLT